MKHYRNGFTLVELMVVIAIIGILAAITIVGFSRFQSDARDAQRQSKITVIAEALEKYYDKNGEYPSCSAVTSSATTVSQSLLPGLDTEALKIPQATAGETNSIECADITGASGGDDYYAYVGDSSVACSTGAACLQFTLKYREESTGNIITIESRRRTDIATSGVPTVNAVTTGFSTSTVSWTAVNNAMNYTLQRATNNAFTTGLVETSHNGASSNVTGLAYNTSYYFRVKANAPNSVSAWSNTDNTATWVLTTPTVAATANSLTQITADWGDITHAASYNIQYSTSSTFASGVVTTTSATSTKVITGLAAGTTYYVRAQAINGAYQGSWGTDSVATPSLATPTITATTNSVSQITVDWADVTYATSYTIHYTTSSTFASYSTTTSATSTRAIGGLNAGTTYYFRVQAVAPADTSNWSATKSAITSVANPSGTPTVAAGMVTASVARGTAASAGTCPAGMSLEYQIRYHSTNTASDGSWSGWTVGTIRDVGAWEGNKYTFQSQARCVGPNASSGFDVSGTANIVRGINTPPAPGWIPTTEWAAGYNYLVTYTWSCPAGTNIGPEGVTSKGNSTPWYDWWYVGWNAGNYDLWRDYNGIYRCLTAYAQTYSPTTWTTVHTHCATWRRSFSSYPRCDNYGQGFAGNGQGNY